MHSPVSVESTDAASASAASCVVPRCPTMAVSTRRYSGSAASAPRAGAARRRISPSSGLRRTRRRYDASMHRRWLLLGCAGVALLAACGAGDEVLSSSCTDRAQVERALARAPDSVTLADGASLSSCLRGATTPALLQDLGMTFTAVAENLETQADDDPAAARRLGYLIGAAR